MERRLAAILAADVVGYSRLMGEEAAGTLRRLTALREQVFRAPHRQARRNNGETLTGHPSGFGDLAGKDIVLRKRHRHRRALLFGRRYREAAS